MAILKQILRYFIWTIVSFLSALIYTRIILGVRPNSSTGFMKLFDWIYDVAFLYVGSILGSIIAILFILIDIFYLKEKLMNNSKAIPIRFLVILLLIFLIGSTHYICEKVIDII